MDGWIVGRDKRSESLRWWLVLFFGLNAEVASGCLSVSLLLL